MELFLSSHVTPPSHTRVQTKMTPNRRTRHIRRQGQSGRGQHQSPIVTWGVILLLHAAMHSQQANAIRLNHRETTGLITPPADSSPPSCEKYPPPSRHGTRRHGTHQLMRVCSRHMTLSGVKQTRRASENWPRTTCLCLMHTCVLEATVTTAFAADYFLPLKVN